MAPFEVMVPSVELPPTMPLTLQVIALEDEPGPVRVAAKA